MPLPGEPIAGARRAFPVFVATAAALDAFVDINELVSAKFIPGSVPVNLLYQLDA